MGGMGGGMPFSRLLVIKIKIVLNSGENKNNKKKFVISPEVDKEKEQQSLILSYFRITIQVSFAIVKFLFWG